MAEYIERKSLLNALKEERKKGNFVFTSKWIKEIMDDLPTADVVEVVRCKDCRHYEVHKPSVTLNCERDGRLIPMNPNDFCSYGERKE